MRHHRSFALLSSSQSMAIDWEKPQQRNRRPDAFLDRRDLEISAGREVVTDDDAFDGKKWFRVTMSSRK